jgi:hypothetical protein
LLSPVKEIFEKVDSVVFETAGKEGNHDGVIYDVGQKIYALKKLK